MTLAQFKEKRSNLLAEMQNIVDTRSDNMDDATLNTVKTLKDEIKVIDGSIEAIETLRSTIKGDQIETPSVDKKEEHRALFDEFVRGKINKHEYAERAVMSGAVGAGAETVPDEFMRELFEKVKEYGVISGDARHITTSDNGDLVIPKIDDTANSGVWTAEGVEITKEDFSTESMTLRVHKVATGIQVSTEFLEDAFFNVESYIMNAFATRLARTVENAYIYGIGNTMPVGVTVDGSTIVSTKAGVTTIEEVLLLIGSIPPSQRDGLVIYAGDDVITGWSLETDAQGRPLLQQMAVSTPSDPVRYTIGGYPIKANYELNATVVGETQVVVGNMSNYIIRDVRNVTVKRDDYTDMKNDMVNFYATMRIDAGVVSANECFAIVKNI